MVEGSRFLEPDKYKGRVKEKFEKRALTYDENNGFHPRVVQMLLKSTPLKQGDAVLDVACGTGLVAFEVSKKIGTSGRVLGIDISNAMVKQAVAKAGQLKAANAEFIVADVEEFSFPEGSFDAILSSSAIPYLQHVPRTFQQFCAWLKKGGVFAFSTPESTAYEKAFALDTFNRLARERFDVRLADVAAGIGLPETVEKVLRGAGFSKVQITKEPNQIIFRDMTAPAFAERMWTQWATFPMCPLHLALSTEQIKALHGPFVQEATKQGEAAQVDGNIVIKFTELIVVATA